MPHLLVTGATGFVGRAAIARAIAAGFRVTAVGRSATEEWPPATEFRSADLLDPAHVSDLIRWARPTHLLHTAWVTTPGACWESPDNARWVGASRHLLHEFASAGGRRAVVTGSCAEYDWSAAGRCDEFATPLRPRTLYGQCKNVLRESAEIEARAVGISLAWARLFFLYGPWEHPDRLVPAVARSLFSSQPIACSAGTQERDYLHVEDAAGALVALLQSKLTGPVNVGCGEAVPVRTVIETVARECGRPDLVRLGARPTPPDDPPLLVAGVKRLRDELGWRPRITLADGLRETVGWWRSRLKRAAA